MWYNVVHMKNRKKLRLVMVLSVMHSRADRMRLAGVLRYAALHPDWIVEIFPEHPSNRIRPPDPANFSGIITTGFFLKTVAGAKRLGKIRPAVILDPEPNFCISGRFAVIREDNRKLGSFAPDFFLRKGLKSFAYVGTLQPRHWSDERFAGFAERLAESGRTASVYRPDSNVADWGRELSNLIRFLSDLPKPCGVLAALDERAKQVLNACRMGGISVPEQISVLGVNNEHFICETAIPTLSSIEPELEESGYLAAAALDRLMHGGRIPHVEQYGIKGIVERLSTSDLSGKSRIVAIAEEFIRRNATTPITPHDIAVACRCSLRLLQRSFAAVLSVSPAKRLRQERLSRVCDMLEKTRTPLNLIGGLCGLPNAKHLKTLFKKTYGLTMGDYRTNAVAAHSRSQPFTS